MNRSLLNTATSPSSDPVHGYHLSQIVQLSYSAPDSCVLLEEYLLNRLLRDNPYTKYKALRVIRHLAEKGKPDFKRSMRRKSESIKVLHTYQGKFDPIHGDSLNKQIREEASKCLTAIFNDDNSDSNAPSFAHRIEGIGSTHTNTYSEGSNYIPDSYRGPKSIPGPNQQKGKYIGMGNPNFDHINSMMPQSSYASSALKALSEVADRYFPSVKETIMKNAPNLNSIHDNQMERKFDNPNSFHHRTPPANINYVRRPYQMPKVDSTLGNEYESKLVDNLLAPGGVLPTIPIASLEGFMIKCRSLDIEVIVSILYDRYMRKDQDDTTKARVLIVIGNLLLTEDPLIVQQRPILQNFIREKLLSHLKILVVDSISKPELKENASVILKALNVEFEYPKVKKAEPEENLLDFMNAGDTKSESFENMIDDIFAPEQSTAQAPEKKKVEELDWDLFNTHQIQKQPLSEQLYSEDPLDFFSTPQPKQNVSTYEPNTPTLFENLTPRPQPSIKNDKAKDISNSQYTTQFGDFLYSSNQIPPTINTPFPFETDTGNPFDTFNLESERLPKIESFPSSPSHQLNNLLNFQDAFISEIFNTVYEKPSNQASTQDPFKNFSGL